jgi:hypothetical protein
MEFDQDRTFRVAEAEDGDTPGFGQHSTRCAWVIGVHLESTTKPIRSGELGRRQPKGNTASGMGRPHRRVKAPSPLRSAGALHGGTSKIRPGH